LWSQRAFEYRVRGGLGHLDVDMAVIVQALVPAEAAGVLFTADPVSGRRDCVVIESSFGLGEAVVGGKVTPDRIVVSRRAFLVERRTTARKGLEVVPAAGGGVRERTVDPARAERACVDDVTAGRLAKLAAQVEAFFGVPQDVEWAVAAGHIHLLQARPITALPPEPVRTWEDRQVWSNANLREAAPDVLTPMTYSLLLHFRERLMGGILRRAGIEIPLERLADLVAGRVYFNVNAMTAILKVLPPMRGPDIGSLLGGGAHGIDAPAEFNLPPEDLPKVRVRWSRRIIRLPDFLLCVLRNPLRTGPRMLAEIKARIAAVERDPWLAPHEEELLRRIGAVLDILREMVSQGAVLLIGIAYCAVFMDLCRRWFGRSGPSIANCVLAGLGGLEDAEAGIALWRLAATAREQPAVEAAIRDAESFQVLRQRIACAPGGEVLLSLWSQFMQTHGHHARSEIELRSARWAEMPDYVLGMVRSYLSAPAEADPVARAARLARQRKLLAAECERKLRNPIRRLVFQALLRRAQQGLRLRETGKSVAVRSITFLRRILLDLGDRLARRGVLGRPDDVFFLRLDELPAVVAGRGSGGGGFDPRKVIASRRAEYERNAAVTPPPVVFGRFDPDSHPPPAVDERTEVFRGIAVSPGLVQGKARVILHAQEGFVLPGEVLVAPFTDPGWTPYFLNAAAIVIDQGGLLSHGSIIAREYGIPCVVNVGPATRVIKTGQTIEVDGNRGAVRILR